jgi:hypothetical protein
MARIAWKPLPGDLNIQRKGIADQVNLHTRPYVCWGLSWGGSEGIHGFKLICNGDGESERKQEAGRRTKTLRGNIFGLLFFGKEVSMRIKMKRALISCKQIKALQTFKGRT